MAHDVAKRFERIAKEEILLMLNPKPALSGYQAYRNSQHKKRYTVAELRIIRHVTAGIGLVAFMGLLAGCAEVVVPGTMAGGSEYYHYTTGNVAKGTLMGDIRQVTTATQSALTRMDIRLHSVEPYTNETVVSASTAGLDITIKIIPITKSTTQVIVDAKEDHIIKKDKATADEILSQIRTAMARKDSNDERYSKIFVKNNCSRSIFVAVRYLTAKNEPEHWQTRGWFELASGQKKHIVDTHNRYIYFYAETRLQDKFYWGGDDYHWFEGERFGFFKADIGDISQDVTQSFNCDK